MATEALPAYVFRGTTIDWPGGQVSINHHLTCTSRHPVIALLFALICLRKNPETAVVYIADLATLRELVHAGNSLEELEDEVVISIQPRDFYPRCIGYVTVAELQSILHEAGIDAFHVVDMENLSRLCAETDELDAKTVLRIVDNLMPHLKYT